MTEILVPNERTGAGKLDNPYTIDGARKILKRHRDDFLEMLRHMQENLEVFAEQGGKTFLAKSPLARKIWVAGAMKTMGFVQERASGNGSCILVFTPYGKEVLQSAKDEGYI